MPPLTESTEKSDVSPSSPIFQKLYGIAYTRYRKAKFWDDACNEYIDVEPQKGSRDLDLVIESVDRRKCVGFEMKVSVHNFLTDNP